MNVSPRKTVPLNDGSRNEGGVRSHSISSPAFTKRAFFCAVVVEGSDDSLPLSTDVQELVASLGDTVPHTHETSNWEYFSTNDTSGSRRKMESHSRGREVTDFKSLNDLIDEFISTERSYVKRLRMLKELYADPLRSYSRNKDTAIIPAYEAKILFGNIDYIVPVNEAFLQDLEVLFDSQRSDIGIGDVALKHFKDLHAFECYKQYYAKREEAQTIFKREMNKKSSTGFAAFIERIKYSSSDAKNRVGLRELLMDPVQRIPRYTLMFRSMIKVMSPDHPQRVKLIEADEIASKIALAETDDHTKRAAIMYNLAASIENFPPALVSNSRHFIDCVDVDDTIIDPSLSSAASSTSINSANISSGTLHCTFFLFDDKLVIVKRSNGDKSGRALAGIDDVEKLANMGSLSRGSFKKSGLVFKGVVDLVDMVATDVAGSDFHIYLESPPKDQSDRWSYRPYRILTVVQPYTLVDYDPVRLQNDKRRFLENLWKAQALYRTKLGQSVALCSDDKEVETKAGKVTLARTYFNVYQRTSFLRESKKTKIVLHIDPSGFADPIPFGIGSPPFVVVRVQPMAGELSRYIVSSNIPNDEIEEDIVQTARVPFRIIGTIHQLGLFKFNTGNISRPNTPTSSIRSRAHVFGLEVISRNFFGVKQNSVRKDAGRERAADEYHKRSKSLASRSSIRTDTTATTNSDSLMKFSYRSSSTAATSFTDEEESTNSVGRHRKLSKRGRSPGVHSEAESDVASQAARSRSCEVLSKDTVGSNQFFAATRNSFGPSDSSDLDLTMRLELARKNSRGQHDKQGQAQAHGGSYDEAEYEDDPPEAFPSGLHVRGRPQGPRAPSPSPSLPPDDLDISEDRSEIKKHQRHVYGHARSTEYEPAQLDQSTIEPLSIKKKGSIHAESEPRGRKKRESSLRGPEGKVSASLKYESASDISRISAMGNALKELLTLVETVQKEADGASNGIKRMQSSLTQAYSRQSNMLSYPNIPSPQKRPLQMTKEAEARMSEMRRAIQQRIDATRPDSPSSPVPLSSVNLIGSLDEIQHDMSFVNDHLGQIVANQNIMISRVKQLTNDIGTDRSNFEEPDPELGNIRRQCEVMKNLLADAQAENEILYEAFNEELDGMFNDVNLPQGEAWAALIEDLRRTKEARNNISKENSRLKRRLEEVESERDGWMELMRSKGFIS